MEALFASILLFFVIVGALTALGFRFWVQPQTAMERVMGQVEQAQHTMHDPALSFRDMLTRIGDLVPANPTDVGILQKRLLAAGYRSKGALRVLYGIKSVLAATFALLAIGAQYGLDGEGYGVMQVLAAGALGWAGPNLIVSRIAAKRQAAVRKGLPNALDMLVICVESGLGLDQSLMQVSKELQLSFPEISDEFAVMNLEIRAGKRRTEALHNLGERCDVDEVKRMAGVLIQADRFGTSISQTLRNFSDYIRVQMRQEAEEKAAKIGVKLVFPIFFFILPALFVVTIGPMMVRVMRDFLPTILGS